MSTLLQDFRFAGRLLLRNPLFTVVAVLSLGLGIGANTAIFSLIDQAMLRPLPVSDPGQLVLFNRAFPYPRYEQFRDLNEVFSGVFAVCALDQVPLGASETGATEQSERLSGRLVSGNYFSVLGVSAISGRALTPGDDRTGEGYPVVVISYGFWKRHFALDPAVIGQTIHLGPGRVVWGASVRKQEDNPPGARAGLAPFTVIGVMPPGFFGETVGDAPDFWAPITTQARFIPQGDWLGRMDVGWVRMVARLKRGMTLSEAVAGMNVLFQQLLTREAGSKIADDQVRRFIREARLPLLPGGRGFTREEHGKNSYTSLREFFQALWILMGIAGLVLLIACANIANLLLARATSRQKEIAVRLSLGATRTRLARQLLTESVLLSAIGGGVGLLFAAWGSSLLLAMISGFLSSPVALDYRQDARVLGFAAAVSLATGLLFGLLPAFRAAQVSLSGTLKDTASSVGDGGRGLKMRRVLVVAQVAISLLLVVVAALFVRSLQNQMSVDLGYDREHLVLLRVDPVTPGYTVAETSRIAERLREQFAVIPGVLSASYSENGLFSGPESGGPIAVDGFTARSESDSFVRFDQVGPGYFGTVGIPLLLGRDISSQDLADRPRVAVINEALAHKYFGDQNPVGKRLFWLPGKRASLEIVGVAKNAQDHSVRWVPPCRFYVPVQQPVERIGSVIFEIRASRDPESVIPALTAAVRAEDAALPVLKAAKLEDWLERSMLQERLIAALAGVFGVLALLLATVGLYGVMSFIAATRTREFGIRLALGARPARIVGRMLGEAMLLVAAGIAVGIPSALASTRLVSSRLFGLKANDPVTLLSATLFLAAVAALAAYLPARKASRLDPLVALRHE